MFIDAAYILILAIYILAGGSLVPFHGDEATQIYMSRDYAYQFMQRDLSLVRYSDPPISAQEQNLRLINGTVNKYLTGLAWHIGGFTIDDINEQWDWGADWNYNQTTGHAPSPELLLTSRIPSALFTAGGVALMFALGFALGGRSAAYLASAFYALNPLILINGRRAMMEGSMILFVLLLVLVAIWLLRWFEHQENRRSVSVLLPVLFGVVSGLALASKHTAVFSVAGVVGAIALYLAIKYATQRKLAFVSAFAFVLLLFSAAATFLALNPAWWDAPLERASEVLRLRQDLLIGQTAVFGGYPSFGDALGGFWRQTFIGLPQYYEIPIWQSYIGDQIAAYEASIWRGVSIGGSTIGGAILLVFVLVGVVALFRRDRPLAARWIIGVWALVVTATTLFLTPLEWGRYYLLMIPVIALLGAFGVGSIGRRLTRGMARHTPS